MIDLGPFNCIPVAVLVAFVFYLIGLGIGGGRDENQEVIDALNPAIRAAQDEATGNLTAAKPSYKAQKALDALRQRYTYDGQYYKWKK